LEKIFIAKIFILSHLENLDLEAICEEMIVKINGNEG
jgi:hypothetical protein